MLYKGSQLAVQDSEIERQIAITRGDQLFWNWNIKPWCLLEKLQVHQELISCYCVTLLITLVLGWHGNAYQDLKCICAPVFWSFIHIGSRWLTLRANKMAFSR